MKIPENIVLSKRTNVRKKTKRGISRRKQNSGNLRRFPENDSVQVLRMNFSLHLGQVMEILPFPRGTRTVWRHLGQLK